MTGIECCGDPEPRDGVWTRARPPCGNWPCVAPACSTPQGNTDTPRDTLVDRAQIEACTPLYAAAARPEGREEHARIHAAAFGARRSEVRPNQSVTKAARSTRSSRSVYHGTVHDAQGDVVRVLPPRKERDGVPLVPSCGQERHGGAEVPRVGINFFGKNTSRTEPFSMMYSGTECILYDGLRRGSATSAMNTINGPANMRVTRDDRETHQ